MRAEEENELREKLIAGRGPIYEESELNRYIHIRYEDFDMREELRISFDNEEIADYLLTFLDRQDVRNVLIEMIYWCPGMAINPPIALSPYFSGISEERRNEIMENIVQIYQRSGQMTKYRLAKRAQKYFKYTFLKKDENG